jgi:hypothetical protein
LFETRLHHWFHLCHLRGLSPLSVSTSSDQGHPLTVLDRVRLINCSFSERTRLPNYPRCLLTLGGPGLPGSVRFPRGAGDPAAPSQAGLTHLSRAGPLPRAPGSSGRGGAAPRPARPQPTPAPGGRAGSRSRGPGEGAERSGGHGQRW